MALPQQDYIFQLAVSNGPGLGVERVCFAARATGLYRSLDGGQTWTLAYHSLHASQPLPTMSAALAPDFLHEPSVFAGLNGAVLCSYDGGGAWQPGRLPSPPPAVTSLVVSPNYTEDGAIFAGTNEDGVLVSDDRGKSWNSWNFGLLDLHVLCLAASPAFTTDETLFAGAESGLFRSTNGGRAWKEIDLPFGFDAVLSLAFSPRYSQDQTVFVGTENNGLLVSKDAGKSWRRLGRTALEEPVNAVAFFTPKQDQQGMIILHGGSLLVSVDGGECWMPWEGRRIGEKNVSTFFVLGENCEILAGSEDGEIIKI